MTLGDAAVEPLVHIKDFKMDFGDTTVIEDLSFDVRAGETYVAGPISSGPLLRTLFTRSVTTRGVRTGSGIASSISCALSLSVVPSV